MGRWKEPANYKPEHHLHKKLWNRCCTCQYWMMDYVNGRDWGNCELMTRDTEEEFGSGLAGAYVIIPDTLGKERAGVTTDWSFGCVQWEYGKANILQILELEVK